MKLGHFKGSFDREVSSSAPGVKAFPRQQRAVVVVADKIGGCAGAAAARRLADRTDLDLVLRVPDVQQEDIVHQGGVWGDHATCGTRNTRF